MVNFKFHERSIENNFYKKTTFLDNIVCMIKTGLIIDLKKFNNLIGGQLSCSLPAVRYVINIDGHRYVILIYNTGYIVLTNLFFLNDLQPIYNYFYNFCVFLLYINVASLNKTVDLDNVVFPYTNRDKCLKGVDEEFEITFQIVNCAFSCHLNEFFFKRKYSCFDIHGNIDFKLNRKALNNLFDFLIESIGKDEDEKLFIKKYSEMIYKVRDYKSFPADIIKLVTKRVNYIKLSKLKSLASQKRKKNNFSVQNMSIHIFKEGKLSFTGSQTKDDVENIFLVCEKIFDYFFL
jgi:hypothetical protein